MTITTTATNTDRSASSIARSSSTPTLSPTHATHTPPPTSSSASLPSTFAQTYPLLEDPLPFPFHATDSIHREGLLVDTEYLSPLEMLSVTHSSQPAPPVPSSLTFPLMSTQEGVETQADQVRTELEEAPHHAQSYVEEEAIMEANERSQLQELPATSREDALFDSRSGIEGDNLMHERPFQTPQNDPEFLPGDTASGIWRQGLYDQDEEGIDVEDEEYEEEESEEDDDEDVDMDEVIMELENASSPFLNTSDLLMETPLQTVEDVEAVLTNDAATNPMETRIETLISSQREHQPIMEITERDVAEGGDMQGIRWSAIPLSRSTYRSTRNKEYIGYRNTSDDLFVLKKEFTKLHPNAEFYKFRYTNLSEQCSYFHFQLRNLIWPTSNGDVYYTYGRFIKHWNVLKKKSRDLVDCFSDPRTTPRGPVRLSSMAASKEIVTAGGYQGEYIVQPLDKRLPPFSGIVTEDLNGITNHMEINYDRSGTLGVCIASNDSMVRRLHVDSASISHEFELPWAVNCCSQSPNRRMLAAVGDGRETYLLDAERGDTIATLTGHLDYSFASAWSHDGLRIATGNQDKSVRIYDTRYLAQTLHVLPAQLGAVRSLRFTPSGMLAFAEDADMVSLVDPYVQHSQSIDFFGEIAGIGFSPDATTLFIGNADDLYGSILEFRMNNTGSIDWLW